MLVNERERYSPESECKKREKALQRFLVEGVDD